MAHVIKAWAPCEERELYGLGKGLKWFMADCKREDPAGCYIHIDARRAIRYFFCHSEVEYGREVEAECETCGRTLGSILLKLSLNSLRGLAARHLSRPRKGGRPRGVRPGALTLVRDAKPFSYGEHREVTRSVVGVAWARGRIGRPCLTCTARIEGEPYEPNRWTVLRDPPLRRRCDDCLDGWNTDIPRVRESVSRPPMGRGKKAQRDGTT